MAPLSRDTQRKLAKTRTDVLAITDRVLPSSEIFYTRARFDAFHIPYPKVAGDYLELRGHAIDTWVKENLSSNQALDCFSRLPLEVFELIFTNLTASELDAARFTCRALYKRIMTSSHILEAVVNLNKLSESKCSSNNRLRDLGRQLEEDVDLLKHPREPGGWRVRYRHCGVDFSCLPSNDPDSQKTTNMPIGLVSTRFCIDGTSIGALIAKSQGPNRTGKIYLYQFCISGRPRYIGSISLHDSEDPVSIRSTAFPDRSETWSIFIEVDKKTSHYCVESSKAFSRDQRAFTIRPVTSPLRVEKTPTTPGLDDKNWVLLGRLPKRDVKQPEQLFVTWACTNATQDPQADATETSPRQADLFHLARHIETDQLYTVCVRRSSSFAEELRSSSGSPRIKTLVPIAKLLSPHQHATYRNIAIAPRPALDGTIQIAIIWQTPTPHGHASELYLYEIPALYQHFSTEIQGKRVRSLGPGVGGIHPSSALSKLSIEDEQNVLSGLSFLQIAQNDISFWKIPKQRIYIYAWGPSSAFPCNSSSGINLHIFDISYSTPLVNALLPHLAPNTEYLRKSDLRYNGCQCALHDDGYRVVLPHLYLSHGGGNAEAEAEARERDGAEENRNPSRWLRIFTRKQDREGKVEENRKAEEDIGSVEWWVEEHVQAAMDRREEWMFEKVRVLRRAGLDDEGVLTAWESRPWAQFGFVGLPVGWKDV